MIRFLVPLVAILALAAAQPVRAQTPAITFKVPVNLQNMLYEAKQIKVTCTVANYKIQGVQGEMITSVRVISGDAIVPLKQLSATSWGYNGIVTVVLDKKIPGFYSDEKLSQVNAYDCFFVIYNNLAPHPGDNDKGEIPGTSKLGYALPKPGTPLVAYVLGPFSFK
jgi:hypothetical protein